MMHYLISPKYFKGITTYNSNTPDKYIIPSIIDAQTLHLEHLINYNLVKKLSDDVYSGLIAEPYLSLLNNLIVPYMVKATEFELLSNTFKYTAQGYVKLINDGAENVDDTEVNARKYAIKQHMNLHGDRITRYLSAHSSEFPEYLIVSMDQQNTNPNSLDIIYIDPDIHAYNLRCFNQKYN